MYDPMFSVETIDAAMDYHERYMEMEFIMNLDLLFSYDPASVSTFLKQQGLWK